MLNPAMRCLLRHQASAKLRRLRRGFSTRRRFLLSMLAVVLAIVWCGNIALSMLLREPTGAAGLAPMVARGLFVYALWHVLKTGFKRPTEAIEWTPAERELLVARPFRRHELIAYRLAGILNATMIKAVCFTLVMLPDLAHPIAGFFGILLGLVFLDLLRINVEITTHGLTDRVYRRFRWSVGAMAGTVVVSSLVIAFSIPPRWHSESTHLTWSILRHVLRSTGNLFETLPGRLALAPFELFSNLIAVPLNWSDWLIFFGLAATVVGSMAWLMVQLDAWFDVRIARRERAGYPPRQPAEHDVNRATLGRTASGQIAWLAGAGPVAWRQLLGANQQRSQLAVALALPGVLAMLPVFVCRDGRQAAVQVAAALTFYSFLLLPTALKFDFRRDILRMASLKTLPIPPVALVVGQISTPAMLALGFQFVVLTAAMAVRPFPPEFLLAALLLLAPLNALIFAVDNLVYLLYPYRLNQEGIEIFLRTTLTFTAKGIIFAIGLALTLLWSYTAHGIALRLPPVARDPALVFVIGGWCMLCAAVYSAVLLLARTYVRFDPSQDTPA